MIRVTVAMMAEIEVDADSPDPVAEARSRLDAMRESVHLSQEYGITLWQATAGDLENFASEVLTVEPIVQQE